MDIRTGFGRGDKRPTIDNDRERFPESARGFEVEFFAYATDSSERIKVEVVNEETPDVIWKLHPRRWWVLLLSRIWSNGTEMVMVGLIIDVLG